MELSLFIMITIVTTFPSLKEDVRLIAVNDTVYSIPAYSHDYELTPKDVEILRRADVIVSTSHTHFEEKIREMKECGELKGILIEIPKIHGIKFLRYPRTEIVNPHMPIYDPNNYKVFVRSLAEVLQSVNPDGNYLKRSEELCKRIDELLSKERLNGTALVDYPFAQYAVSWLGLNVVDVAFNEPMMRLKSVDYLVLTKPLSVRSRALMENVGHKALIYIDSPFSNKSILEKLEDIEIEESSSDQSFIVLKWLLTVTLASVMYGTVSPIVYARRLQFLSAASSHTALLAVLISIPLSSYIPSFVTALIVSLILMYSVGYAISKGIDPNVSTSILVSFTASSSVLAMYYIVTNYEVGMDVWALILGDPLLTTWNDLTILFIVTLLVVTITMLTYREQFHIGLDRDCATLCVNVKIYDFIFYTILAISTVAMIKIVGFVLQHVLILLPCAIAMRFAKGSKSLILSSLFISTCASILGLILAMELNLSPSGVIGIVMFSFYALRWFR